MATLPVLLQTTVANYLNPTPSAETLRNWLDAAKVPRFKANPSAKRGGGPVQYQVAAVEKMLQARVR